MNILPHRVHLKLTDVVGVNKSAFDMDMFDSRSIAGLLSRIHAPTLAPGGPEINRLSPPRHFQFSILTRGLLNLKKLMGVSTDREGDAPLRRKKDGRH